jgi:hypothetical protein
VGRGGDAGARQLDEGSQSATASDWRRAADGGSLWRDKDAMWAAGGSYQRHASDGLERSRGQCNGLRRTRGQRNAAEGEAPNTKPRHPTTRLMQLEGRDAASHGSSGGGDAAGGGGGHSCQARHSGAAGGGGAVT